VYTHVDETHRPVQRATSSIEVDETVAGRISEPSRNDVIGN
jgi:hypothetical protein